MLTNNTENTVYPLSLYILLKAKGQNRCTYQIILLGCLGAAVCLKSLEKVGSSDSGYNVDTEG